MSELSEGKLHELYVLKYMDVKEGRLIKHDDYLLPLSNENHGLKACVAITMAAENGVSDRKPGVQKQLCGQDELQQSIAIKIPKHNTTKDEEIYRHYIMSYGKLKSGASFDPEFYEDKSQPIKFGTGMIQKVGPDAISAIDLAVNDARDSSRTSFRSMLEVLKAISI